MYNQLGNKLLLNKNKLTQQKLIIEFITLLSYTKSKNEVNPILDKVTEKNRHCKRQRILYTNNNHVSKDKNSEYNGKNMPNMSNNNTANCNGYNTDNEVLKEDTNIYKYNENEQILRDEQMAIEMSIEIENQDRDKDQLITDHNNNIENEQKSEINELDHNELNLYQVNRAA